MKELQKQSFDLAMPEQSLQVASILQQFVKEKSLTSNIQGKSYPLVEAWQFAGSQLGLYPICTSIENQSNAEEIKYMAVVEVRRYADDKVVSQGFAVCSNKEGSKRRFDEYAVLSMAQTRATGKAFRNLLAWLMKAAGFEATPAEEMDFEHGKQETEPTRKQRDEVIKLLEKLPIEKRGSGVAKINAAKSMAELEEMKSKLLAL